MRCLAFVFCLALGAVGHATEPFVLKPYTLGAALDSGNVEHDSRVPHLVPVGTKLPEYDYLVQYVVPPSGFSAYPKGYAMAIVRTEADLYRVQVADLDEKAPLEARPKPTAELEIPKTLAEVAYQIWLNAILETRYTRKSYLVLDGTAEYFSAYMASIGFMHGMSAGEGEVRTWLTEAANLLTRLANGRERDAKKTEAALIVLRDKLFNYLKRQIP
jgi:hypothetical protein